MDKTTAHILCDINTAFYRNNATSFSATRTTPWHGWQTCARLFDEHILSAPNNSSTPSRASVFDVACGNLRFEEYLCEQFPQTSFSFFAVDNCEGLLPKNMVGTNNEGFSQTSRHTLQFQNLDVVTALLDEETPLSLSLQYNLCDFSVSFGFMHHIPTQALRLELLQALVSATRPNGLIAVSFWQFLNNEKLAIKARKTHEQALAFFDASDTWNFDNTHLEEGDFFLGWNNAPHQYRYCHNFSEDEVTELACAIEQQAPVLSRFVADGRTHNLNSYLVLQKR